MRKRDDYVKKNFFRVILLIFSVLVLFNIVEEIKGINQTEINKSIDIYFNKEASKCEEGKVKIYSYINLENNKQGIFTEQYSLVKSNTYYLSEGEIKGDNIYKVKFKIISFAGFSKVVSYTLQDGEDSDDIKNDIDKYEKSLTDSNFEKINQIKKGLYQNKF